MSARREAPSLETALAGALRSVPSIESLGDVFPAGVLITDVAGGVVYANPRAQQLFGLTVEELARDGFAPAIEPEDRPIIEREFAAAIAGAAEWQAEFRCCRREGAAITVALRAVPLRSPDGVVTGHIAAVEDISLRSRLYAKLTALIETSRILLDTPRLGAVLPAAVQVARTLIAADGYALWRLNDRGDWRVVESNGVSPAFAAAVCNRHRARRSRASRRPSRSTTSARPRRWPTGTPPTRPRASAPCWRSRSRSAAAGRAVSSSTTAVSSTSTTSGWKPPPRSATCARSRSRQPSCTRSSGAARAAERAHRQAAFLARAGVILGSSLDYEATLKAGRASWRCPTSPTGAPSTSLDDEGRHAAARRRAHRSGALELRARSCGALSREAETHRRRPHVFRTGSRS